MKRNLFVLLSILGILVLNSQDNQEPQSYLDISYFKGNIALHNSDVLHLISGRPEGFILSYNRKTFGEEKWEQRYNYPDYGVSFSYQNLKDNRLGENVALYAHYNFYFFERRLMLRIGQGIAYTTNPYDKIENPKNNAFGSEILSSTYLMFNYKRERVFGPIGLQAGLSLIHYSNANVKAPNTSINTVALNVGLNYNLQDEDRAFIKEVDTTKFTEPIRYNIAFRSGVNESDVIGSGQFPFYILSAYADKRISHTSALQFGADVFFSNFLKELIYYKSVSFPEENVSGNEDYRRVGIFVGHELFINRISIVGQLGYYVYYPFDFEGRIYLRAGLKRYFGNKFFAAVTLKSHGAKAEAVEFGIGVRL
jgi:hypothetical protein